MYKTLRGVGCSSCTGCNSIRGFGDEPAPFKNYTSDYTPTTMPVVDRPPVTTPLTPQPMTPDATTDRPPVTTPLTPQPMTPDATTGGGTFAGFDTTMTVGVIAAVAVLGLIVYRGEMTPNKKSRRGGKRKSRSGRRVKYRAGVTESARVKLKLHGRLEGRDKSSLKQALNDLRYHRLKPGKVRKYTLPSGRKAWSVTVSTTMGKADSFQVKMKKADRFKPGHYESYVD